MRLEKCGIVIKVSALWHQLDKWGLSFKKTLHASEQEREDVQIARREWIENQAKLDVKKLVFLDETGASTNMTRTRGRALKGEHCIASAPHGHWKTTTFIAGLRVNENYSTHGIGWSHEWPSFPRIHRAVSLSDPHIW